MRKRPRADYDDDRPLMPTLTVYEPENGFGRAIGFVRFWTPVPAKPKRAKPVKSKQRRRK